MDGKYHNYSSYTCDKCNDVYMARYGATSDRTSCRQHKYILHKTKLICRDCKKVKGSSSNNCYHISSPNHCCFQ